MRVFATNPAPLVRFLMWLIILRLFFIQPKTEENYYV